MFSNTSNASEVKKIAIVINSSWAGYNFRLDVHEDYIAMSNTFSRLYWPMRALRNEYWKHKEKRFLKYVNEIFIASLAIVN